MNGQWRFVSGCQQAAWFLLLCPLTDGDKPVLDEQAKPKMLFVFLSAAQVTIQDTWYTLGLRGTGSHNIEITDQFVPYRRAAALAPLEQPGSAFTGPLYRLTIWPPIALLAPPALGIARASVDDFVALARGKTPSFTGTTLADRQVVQRQVAQADAHVKAGRSFLHQVFETPGTPPCAAPRSSSTASWSCSSRPRTRCRPPPLPWTWFMPPPEPRQSATSNRSNGIFATCIR